MTFDQRSATDGFGGRRPDQTSDRPSGDPYGKRTLGATGDRPVQLDRGDVRASSALDEPPAVHAAATHGTSEAATTLPHLDTIQRAFGHHDVSGVQAHVGGAAREGAAAMGAEAFATGDHVAFAGDPGLHTAAHEAAHVVQQRAGVHLKGGVGAAGDPYERQADAVADRVVAGQSAEPLLDQMAPTGGGGGPAPVQRFVKHGAEANWGGLGKAMRVSDDGKMAVQDIDLYPEGKGRAHQEFYATSDVSSASSDKLGELQSVYEIATGGALDPKDTGGLTLNRVIASNKVLGDSGHGNATPLNCDDNTRQFMGANLATEEDMNTKQFGATIGSKKGMFKREDVDVEMSPTDGFDKAKVKATEEMTGKKDKQANTAYADMSDKAKDKQAEKVHINQFAKAELGGAYGVWGKSRHFTPILAVSGDDQVSLEAHVHQETTKGPAKDEIIPGDKEAYNPEWYFQMYGPVKKDKKGKVLEDQTFYGQHKEAFPDDKDLMVVAFEKVDTALDKNAKPEEKLRLVKHMITSAAGIADRAAKQLDTPKYATVQNEIKAAIAPMRKDADTIPKKADAYAQFLNDWAKDVDDATIDVGIPSPGDKVISEKVRQLARQLRRVAIFVG